MSLTAKKQQYSEHAPQASEVSRREQDNHGSGLAHADLEEVADMSLVTAVVLVDAYKIHPDAPLLNIGRECNTAVRRTDVTQGQLAHPFEQIAALEVVNSCFYF